MVVLPEFKMVMSREELVGKTIQERQYEPFHAEIEMMVESKDPEGQRKLVDNIPSLFDRAVLEVDRTIQARMSGNRQEAPAPQMRAPRRPPARREG